MDDACESYPAMRLNAPEPAVRSAAMQATAKKRYACSSPRGPGATRPGSVEGRLVSNIDFASTFLEAAGLPIPADVQGRSFVPLLKGQPAPDWRTSFYYEYYEYPSPHHVRPHHGVVTDRYKLVRFDTPDIDVWELFDREKDPREMRSVYADPAYAPIVADLKKELARLRSELQVPEKPPREAYGNQAFEGAAPKKAAAKKAVNKADR